MIAEVSRRDPSVKAETDGEAALVRENGDWTTVTHPYHLYRQHPRALDSLVEQAANFFFDKPVSATPEGLVVVVRSTDSSAEDYQANDRGLARPILGNLIAIAVMDTPERSAFLRASVLRNQLGMDDAAIWARALGNLRTRVKMVPPILEPGRVATLATKVGLASSLLADDAFWNHSNLAGAGDLVVSPIELDKLIVAKVSEGELIQTLRRVAEGYRTANFLSDRLLLRRNGVWEEFE
ncbi:hypothetical protein [Phenylobacterium sp.]|uniref:hypothetical protein n=1 Tax=Phenylobacterium sp. TaxID=1871053 RepID=UPI0011F538DB|nr:hypothetical protein [Phenylobacterium sp.]THD62212.1 MAG: hypothetical protein E8A49_08065 [Phenylobacterium sp.]